jgi:O-acetyl-ADP-ribose deacetylase (regulator of RNase III)
LQECKTLGGCRTGQAKLTKGYNLAAKYVIHTVGPVWRGGDNNEDELLVDCYRNSLKIAEEKNIKTIAFPSISTGAYRFPLKRAAEIATKEVKNFLKYSKNIQEVIFVCFDDNALWIYKELTDKGG